MLRPTILALITICLGSFNASAHDHHVKHNMVIFGEDQVYASHIVYKVPHNYFSEWISSLK
jgi:hypothetical protein